MEKNALEGVLADMEIASGILVCVNKLPKRGNSDSRMLHCCVCQGPGNAYVLWVSGDAVPNISRANKCTGS